MSLKYLFLGYLFLGYLPLRRQLFRCLLLRHLPEKPVYALCLSLIHIYAYQNLFITVLSFGFKYGIPADADLVFDVRFLPNPYYVEELRSHTGEEAAVQAYVRQGGTADEFLTKLYDMLEFLIPNYVLEGKNQLVIAVGCTGGKHRSVTIAGALYQYLSRHEEFGLKIEHRDIDKDRIRKM